MEFRNNYKKNPFCNYCIDDNEQLGIEAMLSDIEIWKINQKTKFVSVKKKNYHYLLELKENINGRIYRTSNVRFLVYTNYSSKCGDDSRIVEDNFVNITAISKLFCKGTNKESEEILIQYLMKHSGLIIICLLISYFLVKCTWHASKYFLKVRRQKKTGIRRNLFTKRQDNLKNGETFSGCNGTVSDYIDNNYYAC